MRIFWIELITGISFALLWWHYGWSQEFWIFAVYTCSFIVVFVIDIDHMLILDKVTYPMAVFAVATAPLRSEFTFWEAIIGGAIGFALIFLVVVVSRGGMGFGDVKFAALMGFALGFPVIFVGLFIGVVTGGLFAIAILALGLKGRKQAIPFGPFLVIGAMTSLLWGEIIGDAIWDFYTF